MVRCFRVTVEYDGTDFAGFQYQRGQRSVQAEIERALTSLMELDTRVHGAGRTDAGVHALGQVVSFRANTRIPVDRLCAAMNSALSPDVAAVDAEEVDERFHARFSARSRAYLYAILNQPCRSALFARYSWQVSRPLDVDRMREAARSLHGTRDFAAWCNEASEVDTTVRTVTRCSVRRVRGLVVVRVEANAFLHGMVRNIVGTLTEIGLGKRSPAEVDAITESRDRRRAGLCAPARGLCLMKVTY